MRVTTEEMACFARKLARTRKTLGLDIDLFREARIDGDDAIEFMCEYSKKFNVNMDDYLWYFHHGEEGLMSLGAIFFAPPNYRVNKIPITIRLLTNCANAGKWNIDYPEHNLPRKRYDILTNQIVVVCLYSVIIATIINLFL